MYNLQKSQIPKSNLQKCIIFKNLKFQNVCPLYRFENYLKGIHTEEIHLKHFDYFNGRSGAL